MPDPFEKQWLLTSGLVKCGGMNGKSVLVAIAFVPDFECEIDNILV